MKKNTFFTILFLRSSIYKLLSFQVEAKIDERTEKEKDEAKKAKEGLFSKRKEQRQEIKMLEVQMRRVKEFEAWEESKRKEMVAIREDAMSQIGREMGSKTLKKSYFFSPPKSHSKSSLNID